MKLLYIGEKQVQKKHGWDQINFRNQYLCEALFDTVTYMPYRFSNLVEKLYIGMTRHYKKNVFRALSQGYDYVFVCQSSCGKICRDIKKKYPDIKIITFFHNVESYYAKQFLKVSGIKAIPYYFRAAIFERMAVKYSDYCITLNDRDSILLNNIYGKHADAVIPTSLEDLFKEKLMYTNDKDYIIDYLFVGTAFYPNIEGVQWFIDKVMPFVKGNLTVVGKDMNENLFGNLSDRVAIYGFVDDLSDYYRRARIVISPIFHGGGMKTKTAEALMYGKYIIATKEAFEGYEIDCASMVCCNTKEDFVNAICNIEKSTQTFYKQSRAVFLRQCSYDSSLKIFSKLLKLL